MTLAAADNSARGFYHTLTDTVQVSTWERRWPYNGEVTPRELNCPHPIHLPTLAGDIDQLLLFDKNWLAISTNTIGKLFDEIDTLSSGGLQSDLDAWEASLDATPNFTHRTNMRAKRNTYLGSAKKTVEVPLGLAATFEITSPGDSNYSSAQNPSQAGKVYVAIGGDTHDGDDKVRLNQWRPAVKDVGCFEMDYRVYSYLEMPTSLVSGETYTITNGSDSVTFLFDEDQIVSRAIKVNHLGYLPGAGTKKAYLGMHLYQFDELDLSHASTFEVINAVTAQVAFSGSVTLVEAAPQFGGGDTDPMYGEDVYEMDFSGMTETGEFYIKVPGVGRSWPFWHKESAYAQLYLSSMKALYRQRNGFDITAEYSPWTRKDARMGDLLYWCENLSFPKHDPNSTPGGYSNFDVCGGTMDYNVVTERVPGGWYDAADWDSTDRHYACVFDLLNAYEFRPSKFGTNQVKIPGSGGTVPEPLLEARHCLELFRSSQNAAGGVSSWLETWTHPEIEHRISGNNPPDAHKCDYGFGTRTRWASLIYAAAAAQYARLVAPFDAADSTLYQQSSIDAYDFGNDSGNSLGAGFVINYTENRGAGPGTGTYTITETDAWIDPYWMHAKLQLWLLTETDSYITASPSVSTLAGRIQNPYVWRWNRQDFSPWVHYSIVQANDAGAPGLSSLASTWESWFTSDADTLVDTYLTDSPYECTWQRTRKTAAEWGATNMMNDNRSLFIAHQLTGTAKYYDAAAQNADFELGCNPLGMSWVTGIGYVYPVDIQHEQSEWDNLVDPWPGITLYGIVGDSDWYFRWSENVYVSEDNDAVTSITHAAGVATVTTSAAHGLSNNDPIIISGANESQFNVPGLATVTGAQTFTYPVDSGAPASATGTIIWQHDFLNDDSQRQANRVWWRRFQVHPTLNTPECEFTVHESIASTLFTAMMLYEEDDTVTETPRPAEYVHGRWPNP